MISNKQKDHDAVQPMVMIADIAEFKPKHRHVPILLRSTGEFAALPEQAEEMDAYLRVWKARR